MTENDPAIVSDEIILPPPPSEAPKQDEPAEKPVDDAKPEDTTAEAKADEEEPEEEEPKPKTSGYARLKARHQALIAEVERLRQPPPTAPEAEPKLDDFNGDYLAFEKASVAFAAKQAIRAELATQRQQDLAAKQAESRHEAVQDFFERAEEAKGKLPDFDAAIDTMYGSMGPLPETVRDLLADSDTGPLILYHLAKNPGVARDLYSAGPIDAARQIGQLEAKMTLPKARNVTKAPPPIAPAKGGATPPRDLYGLARNDDATSYIEARKAMK